MNVDKTPFEEPPQSLSNDLLYGAEAIAEYIFGRREDRRKIYYLFGHTRIPIFRIGSVLCGRRSTLSRWISGQESRVVPPPASTQCETSD